MQNLMTFSNPDFGEIRTIEENGAILFCGSDIAKALGYTNPSKAINDHCKGITKRYTPTAGGGQELLFIPESDLYRLVFSSKLPTAERFTDWVTSEVLPSIRKNGGLFTVKECKRDKTPWSGTQTLVTPKGRETFRLLYGAAI